MTTMIIPHTNGRKRPSLSEQINRLDSMLDGLSEGLNDAVADAVKAAVGTAVKDAVHAVLTEVMTNPEVLAKIHASSVNAPSAKTAAAASASAKPPEPPQPRTSWWQRTCSFMGGVIRESVHKVRSSAAFLWQRSREHLNRLWSYAEIIRHFKYPILTALAVGLLIRAGVWYTQRWFVALLNSIGDLTTDLAAQAAVWLRNVLTASLESGA